MAVYTLVELTMQLRAGTLASSMGNWMRQPRRLTRGAIGGLAAFAVVVAAAPATAEARPGDPDPTFSGDGQVAIRFRSIDFTDGANAVALQPNGRIVAAGVATADSGSFIDDSVVARFKRDGALDSSFGDGGVVRLDFGHNDQLNAVALDGSGRIVVAGTSWRHSSALGQSRMVVARLMPNGQLDTAFADHGVRTFALGVGAAAEDLEIGPHGKILIAGSAKRARRLPDFALVRLDRMGHLDSSFGGGDGAELISFGPERPAYGYALDRDARGRTTVAGTAGRYRHQDAAFARVAASGRLDPSFAGDGRRVVNIGRNDVVTGMAVTSGGGVVAEGTSKRFVDFRNVSSDLFLTRLRPDGGLKGSFGRRGKRIIDWNRYDTGGGLALQRDGKIVLTANTSAGTHTFVVARYQRSGQINKTFSRNGKTVTKIGPGWASYPRDVLLQPNGKIVIVGTAFVEYNDPFDVTRFVVTRYENNGKPQGR
jgi:uncharacterized delta-60 repeat protein